MERWAAARRLGGGRLAPEAFPEAEAPACRRVGGGAKLMPHPGRMLSLSTERGGVGWSARGEERARARQEGEREAAAGALSVPYGHWTLWPGFGIGVPIPLGVSSIFLFFFNPNPHSLTLPPAPQ